MDLTQTQTDRLLQAALDALSLRQRVIGDNIANVDTPNFKASRVDFEQALQRAISRADGPALVQTSLSAAPDGDQPAFQADVVQLTGTTRRQDGNNVDIDQEMVMLTDTNLTYNALAQLVGARMQLLRTIVNDGRR
ncbi:MAG: flagellar basal body rod protein FlgB [Chloroflexi bacterium]|nr:flagellar basal body rod protein FlgB [Chloroflexota bacterium]